MFVSFKYFFGSQGNPSTATNNPNNAGSFPRTVNNSGSGSNSVPTSSSAAGVETPIFARNTKTTRTTSAATTAGGIDEAVETGNIKRVRELLIANPKSVNTCDSAGDSLVYLAVKAGDLPMVRLLRRYSATDQKALNWINQQLASRGIRDAEAFATKASGVLKDNKIENLGEVEEMLNALAIKHILTNNPLKDSNGLLNFGQIISRVLASLIQGREYTDHPINVGERLTKENKHRIIMLFLYFALECNDGLNISDHQHFQRRGAFYECVTAFAEAAQESNELMMRLFFYAGWDARHDRFGTVTEETSQFISKHASGLTPYSSAIDNADVESVRQLLEKGENPFACINRGIGSTWASPHWLAKLRSGRCQDPARRQNLVQIIRLLGDAEDDVLAGLRAELQERGVLKKVSIQPTVLTQFTSASEASVGCSDRVWTALFLSLTAVVFYYATLKTFDSNE